MGRFAEPQPELSQADLCSSPRSRRSCRSSRWSSTATRRCSTRRWASTCR
ncbi:MAG: hypothetical protein MZV70_71400 [Desulfobacterales bacterium]|nr:hypothetical protein [Desulfobacterales bacterium]